MSARHLLNVISVFVVPKMSIVFIEASDRVKDILSENTINDGIEPRNVKKLKIKYMKMISYYVDCDNNVIIIDEEFSDMFSTAYCKILHLPERFIGTLESFKLLVYLLYKQLKFYYDEHELFISKFRCDIFDNILNLQEGCFDKPYM
jgi:hypothetical protein